MKTPCAAATLATLLAVASSVCLWAQESIYANAKGEYVGLAFPLDGSVHAGSCYVFITVTKVGGVEGRMIIGGRKRSVKGSIQPDGQASVLLQVVQNKEDLKAPYYDPAQQEEERYRGNAYLRFDLGGSPASVWGWMEQNPDLEIAGTQVTYKSGRNPAPQKGSYTLIIPGAEGSHEPGGAGYGSIKVEADGTLNLDGRLADGTQISQRTKIVAGGGWALMVPMFQSHGSLLGNLGLGNTAGEGPSGAVFWTKPADHSSKPYPDGWTNWANTVGSPYLRPASKQPPLAIDKGIAVFSGADLAVPWTNTFAAKGSSFVNTGPTRFNLRIASSTGLFNGTFVHPASRKTVSYQGAVLQNGNCGYGYWLSSTKLSGRVYIGPEEPEAPRRL